VSEAQAKKKPGPKSIKSSELMDEICRRIAEGRAVKSICEDEDMPTFSFVWKWISEDAVFEHRYARAIQQRALNHADEITLISQRVMRGEVPPDAARVALDAMKWTASRLLPKVYGDKQIVEANVTHTHQLHLDALRALSNRRSGNDLGYIEGQAIDITNDPTFSGERLDAPQPAIEAVLVVDAADPPRSRPGGGAVSASPTALYTDEKPSDPPLPPSGKPRTPRAKKSKK
jgi:hypothetical protein